MKILIFSLLLLFCVFTVNADMGRITTSDAVVSEDAQQAIIFHNLEEEILILGTDLKADKKTTILRFIPFPSEPTVSLAEGKPFDRVSELMKKHNMVFLYQTKSQTKSGSSSAAPVDVTFSAKIGAHDITVICINEIAEFKEWVAEFLKGKGLAPEGDNQQVENVASDYVKRNIKYFVFDLVEITPEAQFVEPIAYRFKSREFYYPLKTSNTFGGSGGIDLIIITPRVLCDCGPFSQALYITDQEKELARELARERMAAINPDYVSDEWRYSNRYDCLDPLIRVRTSTTTELLRADMKSIYAPAVNFFDKKSSILMQLIRYYGKYDFNEDILIDITTAPQENIFKSKGVDHSYDPFRDSHFGGLMKILKLTPPAVVDPDLGIKEACLQATLSAIELEIERFEMRLEAVDEEGNIQETEKRINELLDEYEKYKFMDSADYLLPDKITVKVKTTQIYQQGSILELKKMSRSGPFYHIAGIAGYDYESVKPDKTYRMTIYPVYQRDYPFPSEYVYIADF